MPDIDVVVCVAFDHRAPADGVERFKREVFAHPLVDSALEVSGTFDLIVEAHFASLAEYLGHMQRLRPVFAKLATRVESNFVSRKVKQADEEEERILWLPFEGGRRRIEVGMIDKVLAEGDYMRVHVGSWNCLLHRTMSSLAAQLAAARFLKLHRSCLVRIDFIDRLIHEGRRWTARLSDGTHVPVAHSSVQQVLHATNGESSTVQPTSSKAGMFTDLPA